MDIREWEYQRGYVEVNLDAIIHNAKQCKNQVSKDTKVLAVIKANAYGHGSIEVATALEEVDEVFGFAVADAGEAKELREKGIKKPILIIGYTFPYALPMLIEEDIRSTMFRDDALMELNETALKLGRKAKVHIKVDTGMGRIGVTPDEKGLAYVCKAMSLEGIEVEGIFTHLATADMTDKTFARKQIATFEAFVAKVEEVSGKVIPIHHCANSATIIDMPDAGMDLVRAGIALYGMHPSNEVNVASLDLQAALSLHSHVVFCKELEEGMNVSYGGMYTTSKTTKIATIPLGYGDGYPRSLSNKGYVLIHGQKAPIIGRVCMDQMMVDVTHIDGVKDGDKVTLIGRNGDLVITAEELGEVSGRFNYELVCDLGKRLPRVYTMNGKLI